MKTRYLIVSLLFASVSTTACDNDIVIESSFAELCEASGGSYKGSDGQNRCECGEKQCEAGVVCKSGAEPGSYLCGGDAHEIIKTVECTKKDDTKCENGSIYHCNGHEWTKHHECDNKASCHTDTNDCGECTNGTVLCKDTDNGAIQQTCIDGKWTDNDTECSGSCNADKTGCGDCTNGEKKCEKDRLYTCEAGSWGTGTQCPDVEPDTPASCMDDDKTCGECLNSKTMCQDGAFWLCTNGTWKDIGIPCGDCRENEQVCVNEPRFLNGSKQEVGALKRCIDKELIPEEYCSNNALCEDNACPKECEPDSTKCVANTPHFCTESGIWEAKAPCSKNATCAMTDQGAQCQNKMTCKDGDKYCNDGKLETCKNNQWNITNNCEFGCDETAGYNKDLTCFECKNGTTTCEKDNVKTCKNHKWDSPIACTVGRCENGACPKCTKDSVKCENDVLTICNNGQWTKLECGSDDHKEKWSCKSDTDCGECMDGSRKVESEYLGLTRFRTCQKGTYSSKIEYCRYGERDYETCHPYNVHVRMMKSEQVIQTEVGEQTKSNYISIFSKGEEAVVYGQAQSKQGYLWYLIRFQNHQAWIRSGEKRPANYSEKNHTNTSTYQGTLEEYKKKRYEQRVRTNQTDTGNVELRCHPSTNSDKYIIGQIKSGEELDIYGHNNNWYETLRNGQIVWILKEHATTISKP